MDALPHFGYPGNRGYGFAMKQKLTPTVSVVTLVTSIIVATWLVFHDQWFALAMGLVAVSPDMIGLYNYLVYEKKLRPISGLLKFFQVNFHRKIQWCERPWGVAIEIVVFIALGLWLIKLQ